MNKTEYAVKVVGGTGKIGAICYKGFDFDGTWFETFSEAEQFKGLLKYCNKSSEYEIISRTEGEANMESNKETQANRHPHADMIIEWANDTSKVVERYDDQIECWVECNYYPLWGVRDKYRFKPAKPERVFPTTSLTEDELSNIYWDEDTTTCNEAFVCIANAAIKQYILDTEKSDER